MRTGFDPFSFLVLSVAGWLNQRQQHVIEYLVEENRVLRQEIGVRRVRGAVVLMQPSESGTAHDNVAANYMI